MNTSRSEYLSRDCNVKCFYLKVRLRCSRMASTRKKNCMSELLLFKSIQNLRVLSKQIRVTKTRNEKRSARGADGGRVRHRLTAPGCVVALLQLAVFLSLTNFRSHGTGEQRREAPPPRPFTRSHDFFICRVMPAAVTSCCITHTEIILKRVMALSKYISNQRPQCKFVIIQT